MSTMTFSHAMDLISDRFINEAAVYSGNDITGKADNKIKSRKNILIALAACIAIVCAVAIIPSFFKTPHLLPGYPNPIAGKALTVGQIPLEWFEASGSIGAFVYQQDGTKNQIEVKDRASVIEIAELLVNYDWTINVSEPSLDGFSSEGDVVLFCEGMRLSFWHGMDYVRYKSGKDEKWFLSSAPMGQQRENIAQELEMLIKLSINN